MDIHAENLMKNSEKEMYRSGATKMKTLTKLMSNII